MPCRSLRCAPTSTAPPGAEAFNPVLFHALPCIASRFDTQRFLAVRCHHHGLERGRSFLCSALQSRTVQSIPAPCYALRRRSLRYSAITTAPSGAEAFNNALRPYAARSNPVHHFALPCASLHYHGPSPGRSFPAISGRTFRFLTLPCPAIHCCSIQRPALRRYNHGPQMGGRSFLCGPTQCSPLPRSSTPCVFDSLQHNLHDPSGSRSFLDAPLPVTVPSNAVRNHA